MKILLTERQVREGVAEMAAKINRAGEGRPLTVIAVMTGAVVLLADLIRQLEMPLRVGVLQASSYRGMARGDLAINSQMMPDIEGRDVLLVDDIFDTGHTLAATVELIERHGAASVRSAVLLRKAERREAAASPDFVAFDIPDQFVVGYGLDYDDHYRNLPYIAVLEPEDVATC